MLAPEDDLLFPLVGMSIMYCEALLGGEPLDPDPKKHLSRMECTREMLLECQR